MTFDLGDGRRANRAWHMPRSYEDLVAKRLAMTAWAETTPSSASTTLRCRGSESSCIGTPTCADGSFTRRQGICTRTTERRCGWWSDCDNMPPTTCPITVSRSSVLQQF
ncbi:hypothetical protein [Candidatus Poriferisodalis sp.]|uniref:hypothetical protein n=1 Tax=Candidatus Poriferisodalis sp. TaxID=3101277 RepID=UPI003B02186E